VTKPRIAYAGMTHLGLCSGIAAASKGFETVCFDADPARIADLDAGRLLVVEPGLPELLRSHRERVQFTAETARLADCDVVYVAPDIPTDDRGGSDLRPLIALLEQVAPVLKPEAILVILSQVPPGFTRGHLHKVRTLYYQVETLVFGRAVERATEPERFIVGCADPSSPLPPAYRVFLEAFGCPILPMRLESAELAKISINMCLVASVSVANTLAELSERIGADWSEIAPALKLDRRIGPHSYLSPGLGLAGGNLERDLATVVSLALDTGSEVGTIEAFIRNSRHRRDWALRALHQELLDAKPDAVIGVLGLAYKENTHSTKNSPSFALIERLTPWRLKAYDPVVPASQAPHPRVDAAGTPLAAAQGTDALAIMTPWPQFRDLRPADLKAAMRGRLVIDPYRVLKGREVAAAGLDYVTLGVPPLRASGVSRHA
jgi:UDPglucose 6-dehydrogenase